MLNLQRSVAEDRNKEYVSLSLLRTCVAGLNIRAAGDIASQKSEILMSYLGPVFGFLLGSTNEASRRYFVNGSE